MTPEMAAALATMLTAACGLGAKFFADWATDRAAAETARDKARVEADKIGADIRDELRGEVDRLHARLDASEKDAEHWRQEAMALRAEVSELRTRVFTLEGEMARVTPRLDT